MVKVIVEGHRENSPEDNIFRLCMHVMKHGRQKNRPGLETVNKEQSGRFSLSSFFRAAYLDYRSHFIVAYISVFKMSTQRH